MEHELATLRVLPVVWGTHLAKEALRVRYEVFVAEQNVPMNEEIDAHDPRAWHLLIIDGTGRGVGTGRLLDEPGTSDTVRIGRMAVVRAARGRGIGKLLMSTLIQEARRRSARRIVLSAQVHAIPFYESFGFTPHDPIYMDAGIPHKGMDLFL